MARIRRPSLTELFGGGGLFGGAFAAEGFRVVRAIEVDSIAAETYRLNLGDHVEVADVRDVRPTGRCDVILAGPPCQGFSTLGKRDPRDERNQLTMEVVRWAAALRPQVVVVENVEAFLRSAVWQALSRRLKRLGYDVHAFVLNALDFGVPQLRRRSFTIATRVGLQPIRRCTKGGRLTVREAWRGLSAKPDGRNNHYAPVPSTIALARMKVIPRGGDKRDVLMRAPHLAPPSWRRVQSEATDVWGRMHWDRPCNTLRTALQNASKGRYIHPQQHRVISLREAARLHSMPDSWEFVGLHTQIARQIGNGVPWLLGRSVARAVRRSLG